MKNQAILQIFLPDRRYNHVDHVLRETGDIVDNGFHEIYVNTEIDDGTNVAAFMKVLKDNRLENDKKKNIYKPWL